MSDHRIFFIPIYIIRVLTSISFFGRSRENLLTNKKPDAQHTKRM